MSRLFSIMLGVVLAFSASSANAAFTFSFNPASLVNASPGGSGSFDVDIVGTGGDVNGGLFYTFNLSTINPNFTFATNPTNQNTPFTAPTSRTVNFSVSALAPIGDVATVIGNFTAFGPDGPAVGLPFQNTLRLTAVPEPSSMALVGLVAVAGIAFNLRRLRQKAE